MRATTTLVAVLYPPGGFPRMMMPIMAMLRTEQLFIQIPGISRTLP
jgi:hypothetical protein